MRTGTTGGAVHEEALASGWRAGRARITVTTCWVSASRARTTSPSRRRRGAYLRSQLYPGDPAWSDAVTALDAAVEPMATVESK